MSSRSRRQVLLAGLVVAVVLAATAAWLVLRPGSEPGAASGSQAPPAGSYGESVLDASGSAAPTQVPEVVLADVPGLPETLTPVALAEPSAFRDGVTARLVDIKSVTGEAHLPGETAGPALAVIVELTNSSGEAVSLDTVAVNVYLGSEGTRAARVQADSGAPFSGTLRAGASAEAVYAFRVPQEKRDAVTVTVGHSPDAGTAVFSGAVA